MVYPVKLILTGVCIHHKFLQNVDGELQTASLPVISPS